MSSISQDLRKSLGADLRNGITIEYVQKYVVPPLGIEYVYPIFKKYGKTYSHIGEGWVWNEQELRFASQEDLWQMMAIASMYWENKYKTWYREKNRKG